MFAKTNLPLLVTILVGWTAQAQQAQQATESGLFTASGIEAVDSDKTFQSAKNSATAEANEYCSPLEAKQVSEWDYKITKAGYLHMVEVTATFMCVPSHF